jgi:signal transduction histidine kinase
MGAMSADYAGLARLGRAFAAALHDHPEDRACRCQALANALHVAELSLIGCGLFEREPVLAILDAPRASRPDLVGEVTPRFTAWMQGPATEGLVSLGPVGPSDPGLEWTVTAIHSGQQRFGGLLQALPADAPEAVRAEAEARLEWAASQIGAMLHLEACHAERKTLLDEQDRQSRLVGIGDLTEIVAHEFNNILNNILLHLAVLEQRGLPDELRPETAVIRQRGLQAAQMVKKLQQLSRRQQLNLQAVDLNQTIREVLGGMTDGSPSQNGEFDLRLSGSAHEGRKGYRLRLELSPSLPLVLAISSDLRRLLDLLVLNACLCAPPNSPPIVVRTGMTESGMVQLCVEDAGPIVSPEELRQLFEPFTLVRPGNDGIRLAIAKAITRRLQGTLRASNHPGGMSFEVDLRRLS